MAAEDSRPVAILRRVVSGESGGDPSRLKAELGSLYDRISQALAASPVGDMAWFLNFGYVAGSEANDAVVEVAEDALGRSSIRLMLETVGGLDLRARDVLDVGCGRGGNVRMLDRYLRPKTITGLDLSSSAIAFCTQRFASHRIKFVQGDAEQLPFADQTFEAVLNVESSHNYPDVDRFYHEVGRVLRVDGYFLYADLFPRSCAEVVIERVGKAGFTLLSSRDITANVLRARDCEGAAQAVGYGAGIDPEMLAMFLGLPGTPLYEDLQSGALEYRIFRFKRSAG